MEKMRPNGKTNAEKFMKKIIAIISIFSTSLIFSACSRTTTEIQKNSMSSPSPSVSTTPQTPPPEYIDGQPLEPIEDNTTKNLNEDNLDEALKNLNEVE